MAKTGSSSLIIGHHLTNEREVGDCHIDVMNGDDVVGEGDEDGVLWHHRQLQDRLLAEVLVRPNSYV